MLLGLGKPRFYKKSIILLKHLKTRLETIKKKKNAVLKFMKNDVADLLRNGLDINAYGRAEGLIIERNMATCYDIIEQCIGCISGQLSSMQKQKECPVECREAIPTLMYAAARFADLPELRDLRALFTDRYGNSLDSYVNKEFVERLKSAPPSKETKLLVLQEIAQEFSIQWDSKALQQKLYTPPPPIQQNPKQGSLYNKENNEPKHLQGKDDSYNLPSSSEDEVGANLRRDSSSQDSRRNSSTSVGSVSDDEADSNKKPFYYRFIPPPYIKSDPGKERSTSDDQRTKSSGRNANAEDDKKPRSVRKNKPKPPPGDQAVTVSADMREKQARQRAEALLDGEESDEEKRLDSLLMHYSKKKAPQEASSTLANRRRHTSDNSELYIPPGTASSVPNTTIPLPEAAKEGIIRTNSMEGDKHVHPKLPDYDDLAARIAAIRGL